MPNVNDDGTAKSYSTITEVVDGVPIKRNIIQVTEKSGEDDKGKKVDYEQREKKDVEYKFKSDLREFFIDLLSDVDVPNGKGIFVLNKYIEE